VLNNEAQLLPGDITGLARFGAHGLCDPSSAAIHACHSSIFQPRIETWANTCEQFHERCALMKVSTGKRSTACSTGKRSQPCPQSTTAKSGLFFSSAALARRV